MHIKGDVKIWTIPILVSRPVATGRRRAWVLVNVPLRLALSEARASILCNRMISDREFVCRGRTSRAQSERQQQRSRRDARHVDGVPFVSACGAARAMSYRRRVPRRKDSPVQRSKGALYLSEECCARSFIADKGRKKTPRSGPPATHTHMLPVSCGQSAPSRVPARRPHVRLFGRGARAHVEEKISHGHNSRRTDTTRRMGARRVRLQENCRARELCLLSARQHSRPRRVRSPRPWMLLQSLSSKQAKHVFGSSAQQQPAARALERALERCPVLRLAVLLGQASGAGAWLAGAVAGGQHRTQVVLVLSRGMPAAGAPLPSSQTYLVEGRALLHMPAMPFSSCRGQ